MLDRRRLLAFSAAATLAPVLSDRGLAQTWPSRFVKLVVPFPPGGGTDAIARIVAGKLSEIWGQQVVVENRGGAATNIGTEAVARAEADGYTLLLCSLNMAVNRYLFPTLSYDPVTDFAPGLVPSRVTWMLTMGMVLLLSLEGRSMTGALAAVDVQDFAGHELGGL